MLLLLVPKLLPNPVSSTSSWKYISEAGKETRLLAMYDYMGQIRVVLDCVQSLRGVLQIGRVSVINSLCLVVSTLDSLVCVLHVCHLKTK